LKILITGKRDRLWKAVAAAFAGGSGIRAVVLPVGSPVISAIQDPALDAILYTLSNEEDLDLLRWIIKLNPSLPLIALLPRLDAKTKKKFVDEGATQVLEIPETEPTQIRRNIVDPELRKLLSGEPSSRARHISGDLHAVRSALTAILGRAELAMKRTTPRNSRKKQLREIPSCVAEIDTVLRRLDRKLKSSLRPAKRSE
jgi:signal transduction histidine kinase